MAVVAIVAFLDLTAGSSSSGKISHKGPYLNDVYTEGGGGVNKMKT